MESIICDELDLEFDDFLVLLSIMDHMVALIYHRAAYLNPRDVHMKE